MKRWITGAVFAAGLTIFGGAAVAQDAGDGDQWPGAQAEKAHTGDHEGCRFGEESFGNDT